MKKLSIKVISLVVVVICIVSTYCIPSSAVDIVYNYNNRMYTSISNQVGRSIAMYAQEMGTCCEDSTLRLQSSCAGGPIDEYITSFEVRVNSPNMETDLKIDDTDSPGYNGTLQYTSIHTDVSTAQGYTEHISMNKTNTSDEWRINYLHRWSYSQGGWQPYGS